MARRFALTAVLMLGFPAVALGWHEDPPLEGSSHAGAVARAVSRSALAPAGLPVRWCGAPTQVGAGGSSGPPAFQLVYAHPADTPDRFAEFAPRLQATVSYIDRFVSKASDRTKFLRFVMGTGCGAQYVSIIDWTMPRPRAEYVIQDVSVARDGAVSSEANFGQIDADGASALGRTPGRNMLVYVDGLFTRHRLISYGGSSEALDIGDARPGPENSNNNGGQLSFVWGSTRRPLAGQSIAPDTFLHEASHAIGAVSYGSPHSTGAGHCTYVSDIMCYADGGPDGSSADLVEHCASLSAYAFGGLTERYDCSGDDYFNPNPAPGSYLATHWNLYNSLFMAPCTELAQACGYTPTTNVQRWALPLRGLHARIMLVIRVLTRSDGQAVLHARLTRVPHLTRVSLCVFPRARPHHLRCAGHRRFGRVSRLVIAIAPSYGTWRRFTVLASLRSASWRRVQFSSRMRVTFSLP